MIIKRKSKKIPENIILKFNGKKMEQCLTYKYLGVHLDESLNWKAHVDYLCKKLSKMCGIFSKLRHCCSKDLMKVLYFALVKSHLQYCNMIWGNANKNVLKPLINLQNKIIKIMCFAPYASDEVESLYTDLKLLSLEKLHKLSKAKFMYKFKNAKLPSNFDNFFTASHSQHNYALRSRDTSDYRRVWGKTRFGKQMLQDEEVQLWNNISTEIRNSNSIIVFKKFYKIYLLECT